MWPAGPVTLADLANAGKLLWVYCCDCGRERDVDPLSVPLPPTLPVPSVGTRMKCSACNFAEDQHQARALPRRK